MKYLCPRDFRRGEMEEKMINLYMHGGSENHGCEAIVRSSINMLDKRVQLFSLYPEQDYRYGVNEICDIKEDREDKLLPKSKEWFFAGVQAKLTHRIDREIRYSRRALIDCVQRNDICLSVGGDNYCYKGTEIISSVNANLRRKGAKLVLWGCSIEPELIYQKEIANDLKKYNLITARETISYNALKKINNNTVLVSDPAFTLKRVDAPFPNGFQEKNVIGINISPLILSIVKDSRVILRAFNNLISYILNNTNYSVALIPHVIWENNDDRSVLKTLYSPYKNSNRIKMIEDCNCMQLKGYIARCKMFIGARTHATIAAYSSNVPTLVIGYSVKAKGIARDIFGTEENYVLPVQDIHDDFILIDQFRWMENNYISIKKHLIEFMPKYIDRAYTGLNCFNKLL